MPIKIINSTCNLMLICSWTTEFVPHFFREMLQGIWKIIILATFSMTTYGCYQLAENLDFYSFNTAKAFQTCYFGYFEHICPQTNSAEMSKTLMLILIILRYNLRIRIFATYRVSGEKSIAIWFFISDEFQEKLETKFF